MITKELFIEAIGAIEKQFKHDEECEKAIHTLYVDGGGYYNYYPVLQALENILKEELNDQDKDSWIDYFIYELDFGKNWTKSSISHNGKSIKMRNAGELYEYLTLNK